MCNSRGVIGSQSVNRNIVSNTADASRCFAKENMHKEHAVSMLSLIGKWPFFSSLTLKKYDF